MRVRFDERDAARHLEKIQSYWARLGYEIKGDIAPINRRGAQVNYKVVTNLRNGLPRKFRCEDLTKISA